MGRNDAAQRGWGSGWPACHGDRMVYLRRRDGFAQPLRREIVPIVAWLMDETERRGYDIHPDWSWGFNCRAIRGSNWPSNHSWGLALDINAPTNPMISGALHSDMPDWLPGLWKAHGFYWGGDYGSNRWDGRRWVGTSGSRYDAMHMEYVLSPFDAAHMTASINGQPGPGPNPPPVTPPPFRLGRALKPGMSGDDVKHAQSLLLWMSVRHQDQRVNPGKVDGIYGAQTERATLAFKREVDDLDAAFKKPPTFGVPLNADIGAVTYGTMSYWAAH